MSKPQVRRRGEVPPLTRGQSWWVALVSTVPNDEPYPLVGVTFSDLVSAVNRAGGSSTNAAALISTKPRT